MSTNSWWEKIEATGSEVVDQLKRILHEGNVRRVVIKQGDRTIAEFPLTVGIVGTMVAPILAAVGALVALLAECSLEVEHTGEPPKAPGSPPREPGAPL
jgi:Domain of unknown function (DUF4342)